MVVSVRGLSFQYGQERILDEVEFAVHAGELLAILGPNGVGKTTLLKCINAIHAPSCGTVMVENRNVLRMRPNEIALDIGYVPQRSEPARHTVFDAVLMGRKPHIKWRVTEYDLEKVNSAIRQLNMTKLSLRYIDELSGGELQKVAIARAMVQEPRLMLLDEPTSSLDLKSQVDILKMLKHITASQGLAAIMTMHDLNTALRYADKFIFLKNGSIHSIGPTSQVTSGVVEDVYGLPVDIHTVQGRLVVVPAA